MVLQTQQQQSEHLSPGQHIFTVYAKKVMLDVSAIKVAELTHGNKYLDECRIVHRSKPKGHRHRNI